MNRDELRWLVYEANMQLPALGLVLYTWGNVSMIDRASGEVAIKPSGVEYAKLRPEDIVVVSLDGSHIEGSMKPSSDLPTHLVLYRAFDSIGGIVHTHSTHATAWAQACTAIPCFGTTHADYFYGTIPCTRPMKGAEIRDDYEANTGHVIAETFKKHDIDPAHMPAALVGGHGPFSWGRDGAQAVHNAAVLEEVARMAMYSVQIHSVRQEHHLPHIKRTLLDKHFLRKHGKNAYYGQ